MSKKNVETPKNGQDTKKKDKTPTGKVITLESKKMRDAIRKKREEEYKNNRINAFRRRCKRMKISEEDTEKYVEKLVAQLEAPHQYAIHVLFSKGTPKLAKEAILNAKIECKFLTNDWAYIIGDDSVLSKLREIMPGYATIHPHVLKAESILPVKEHTPKKPSNNSKDVAHKAKMERKARHASIKRKKNIGKSCAKQQKRKSLLELKKKRKAAIVQMKDKKSSTGLKKASMGLKQAA